ncbi:MAG: ParA family protein, partial [Alphaproteobacteria bacterium]|nr:ParA family protein [Alphaproteobacteria bacterium]
MKVVVLASAKGGVGKTTLAAHLAVHSEAAGTGPVVVFDTDPQDALAGGVLRNDVAIDALALLGEPLDEGGAIGHLAHRL